MVNRSSAPRVVGPSPSPCRRTSTGHRRVPDVSLGRVTTAPNLRPAWSASSRKSSVRWEQRDTGETRALVFALDLRPRWTHGIEDDDLGGVFASSPAIPGDEGDHPRRGGAALNEVGTKMQRTCVLVPSSTWRQAEHKQTNVSVGAVGIVNADSQRQRLPLLNDHAGRRIDHGRSVDAWRAHYRFRASPFVTMHARGRRRRRRRRRASVPTCRLGWSRGRWRMIVTGQRHPRAQEHRGPPTHNPRMPDTALERNQPVEATGRGPLREPNVCSGVGKRRCRTSVQNCSTAATLRSNSSS